MLRLLISGFVVAHGVVTVMAWGIPAADTSPFDASHSWIVGDARGVADALAMVAGAVAVVPMTVYFNTWPVAGLAISLAILAAGARTLAHS